VQALSAKTARSYNPRTGKCFPSYETIATAGVARSIVAEAIKALEAAEILLRKCLPDLVATDFYGELEHKFVVAPEPMEQAEWFAA
jgi:hypothetical protein